MLWCLFKRITSWLVASSNYLALLLIAATVTYLYFVQITQSPPFVFTEIRLVNNQIHRNEPLEFYINAKVVKEHCDMYSERIVIDQKTDQIVWHTYSNLNVNLPRQEIRKPFHPFPIYVESLEPGKYYYLAKVHAICDTKVDIIATPLISFEILPD